MFNTIKSEINMRAIMHCKKNTSKNLNNQANPSGDAARGDPARAVRAARGAARTEEGDAMMPALIGLTGYSGSGKDTVARLLAERHRVARLAFADELKREVAAAWHVDVALFHDAGLKDVSLHQLELARCTNVEFVAFHWHLADLGALKPRTVLQAWGDWVTSRDPLHYVRAVDAQLREIAEAKMVDDGSADLQADVAEQRHHHDRRAEDHHRVAVAQACQLAHVGTQCVVQWQQAYLDVEVFRGLEPRHMCGDGQHHLGHRVARH